MRHCVSPVDVLHGGLHAGDNLHSAAKVPILLGQLLRPGESHVKCEVWGHMSHTWGGRRSGGQTAEDQSRSQHWLSLGLCRSEVLEDLLDKYIDISTHGW